MELDRLLRGIRSLDDLPALMAALGHHPLRNAVPGLPTRRHGPAAGPILVVGRAGDFPWFAVASGEPLIRSKPKLPT